jgi:hypothetical protein
MFQHSKLSIQTVLDAFNERSKLVCVSLAKSLAYTLTKDAESKDRLTDKDFLDVVMLEGVVYTILFFDFLFFSTQNQ